MPVLLTVEGLLLKVNLCAEPCIRSAGGATQGYTQPATAIAAGTDSFKLQRISDQGRDCWRPGVCSREGVHALRALVSTETFTVPQA